MPANVSGPESHEMLCGWIEERDDALGIDGDYAAVHRRENVVNVVVHQYDVLVELSILHGYGGLTYQGVKEIDVFGEEGISRAFAPDYDEADKSVCVREGKCNVASEGVQGSTGGRQLVTRGVAGGFFTHQGPLLTLEENDQWGGGGQGERPLGRDARHRKIWVT